MSLKQMLLGKDNNRLLSMQNIGIVLVCFYILTSFVAVNIGISSTLNSVALILMLFWTALCVIRSWKTKEFPISGYTAWYFVFMMVSFVTMTYSPEFNILSGEFYLMIVSFIVTFSIINFVKKGNHFKIIAYVYIISAVILVVMLYAKGMLNGSESDRLGGSIMGNANTFALMMMVATMLGIWLLLYGSSKKDFYFNFLNKCYVAIKVLLCVAIVVCLYAIVLSGGRKYFILPFLFFYILLVFKKDRHGRTHFWLYTAIIIGVIVVVYLLIMHVKPLYNALGYRVERFLQGTFGNGELDGSSVLRTEMQQYAMDMWIKSPLFGYGFDSFKYYNVEYTGQFYYSHCNFTELLFNGGLLLFVAYYYFFFYIARKIIKAKDVDTKYRVFALAILICTLIFDFMGIGYSAIIIQIALALSCKVLDFKKEESLEVKNG